MGTDVIHAEVRGSNQPSKWLHNGSKDCATALETWEYAVLAAVVDLVSPTALLKIWERMVYSLLFSVSSFHVFLRSFSGRRLERDTTLREKLERTLDLLSAVHLASAAKLLLKSKKEETAQSSLNAFEN